MRESIAAFVGYAALSALLYGRPALAHLQSVVVGFGPQPAFYGRDQSGFVWCLAWGLHQLEALHSPLSTHAIFAPFGFNLAWAASIQGPALLMSPVTAALGPVASYDLLALAAPATAAWCAHLLCRHGLLLRRAPSLTGGLLFGFGTYETVQMINHVNLALTALVPLAALLGLLRHSGRMSRTLYVLSLGLLLTLQLWTSTEVLAAMIGFGALALLLGALLGAPVRDLAVESLAAILLAALLGFPFLYAAFAHTNPAAQITGAGNGTDLLNLIAPTRASWISWLGLNAPHGSGTENLTEQLAYLGLPLLALLASFALGLRRARGARIVGWLILAGFLASLGSQLILGGSHTGIPMPWAILGGLPLLRFIMPGRFALWLWLGIALAGALWLQRPSRPALRWGLLALVLVTLAPNVTGIHWGTRVDRPALTSSPDLARYVPAGSTVLALPFGIYGDSMYWQVQADFHYDTAGGYVGLGVPASYRRHARLLDELGGAPFVGSRLPNLCAFLRETGARTILLRLGTPGEWDGLLDPLGIAPVEVGGFRVYRLAPAFRSGGACGVRPA